MQGVYRGLALMAFAATAASGQGFSGTIEARVLTEATPPQYLHWSIRGPQTVLQLTDEGDQVAVQRVIYDRSTRVQWEQAFVSGKRVSGTQLVPDTVPNLPLPDLQLKGPGEPVAGHECDEYGFAAGGYQLTGCFSDDLGSFVAPRLRGPLAIPQLPGVPPVFLGFPDWALSLNGSKLFPLRVKDASGQVVFEVKRITDDTLPTCFYEIPRELPAPRSPTSMIARSNTQRAPAGGRTSVIVTLLDGRQSTMLLPATVATSRNNRLPPAPTCEQPRRRPTGGGL